MSSLRSILVPVDGSSPSLSALDHALALAEDGDATVEMLFVDDPDKTGFGNVDEMAPDTREQLEHDLDDAEARAVARLGSRVSRRRLSGETLRTIIAEAISGDYDLIVIGTHGRVGRLHELTGSVAEALIRNAPCPVLCVREPGEGYQGFAERRHGRPTITEQLTH